VRRLGGRRALSLTSGTGERTASPDALFRGHTAEVCAVRQCAFRSVSQNGASLHPPVASEMVHQQRNTPAPQHTVLGVLSLSVFLLFSLSARAQMQSPDLTQMTLEDLLEVKVTTVAKKPQTLARTAAAVYVITAEEIARSGLTSIPEVLRLAPGVQVAQIDSSTWAIAIRGFNSEFSNKLLVMIDGRTVYLPSYSGVLWNIEDFSLQEVERIEVVRGPGAAVWGANAVNGVINIITRNAKDTQGGLLAATAGSYDQAIATLRYGGKVGGAAYRASARYEDRGTLARAGGSGNQDRWALERARLRGDWDLNPQNSLMLEGELFQSESHDQIPIPILDPPSVVAVNTAYYYTGGSLLLRWNHTSAGGSQTTLQAFYDRAHDEGHGNFASTDQTWDFDFQQQTHVARRNDLVWGLGLRFVEEETTPSPNLFFVPNNHNTKLFSAFAQDEIQLVANHLWFTLGSKFEHNTYTGGEFEPNARLLWELNSRHSVWAAVSRAVRTPSTYEEAVHFNTSAFPGPDGLPALVTAFGNPAFESEKLIAYEAGYRAQLGKRTSLDVALFRNAYNDISSLLAGQPFFDPDPTPHVVFPLILGGFMQAYGHGGEVSAALSPARCWKLTASYSLLHLSLVPVPAEAVPTISNGYPQHQWQAHSYFTLAKKWQLDAGVYSFAHLPGQPVQGYSRVDAHLGWSPNETLRLNLGLQNLLAPRHLEFFEPNRLTEPGEVRRAVYGKVIWSF